jgi:hypothetical protein
MWAREMKAARMMLGGLRRVAADFRALGQPLRSLDSLERGLTLVPREATGPLHAMRAQIYEELGRPQEAHEAAAEAARVEEALRRRAGGRTEAPTRAADER